MKLLHPSSLADTVNAVGDALFFQIPVPGKEAHRVAEWIAGRQGLPGSYAGMFAPTEADYGDGIRLFTGERITSGAATGHILGEEACRLLYLLGVDTPDVARVLKQASTAMDKRLKVSEREMPRPGFF